MGGQIRDIHDEYVGAEGRDMTTPGSPVTFSTDFCTGCNICVNVCQVDVYIPNPENGSPPIILHPDECWYCGCCVMDCRYPGAVSFNWPLQQRGSWKEKTTGKVIRDNVTPWAAGEINRQHLKKKV